MQPTDGDGSVSESAAIPKSPHNVFFRERSEPQVAADDEWNIFPWPSPKKHKKPLARVGLKPFPPLEINRAKVPCSAPAPPWNMSWPPTHGAGAYLPIPQAQQHPPQHPPPISQPPHQYPIQPVPQQAAATPSSYPLRQDRPCPPSHVEYHGSSSHGYYSIGAKTSMVEEVERSRMLRNTPQPFWSNSQE